MISILEPFSSDRDDAQKPRRTSRFRDGSALEVTDDGGLEEEDDFSDEDGDAEHPERPKISTVAPELTPSVFAPDGWLHQALQLQHRPQQANLAAAIARAFSANSPLLCEAGTGVGKSLAYLVPGLIHAIETGRQLVVSTHTIPLQEQIQRNDLEKCRALFERVPELRPYAAFKTALLVGKANYLCSSRLARALQNHAELLESTHQSDLRVIQEWAARTESGLREDLPVPVGQEVWDWVNADSSLCNRRNCSPKTCPYQRARERIAGATLVIVNHALLLSLIAAGVAPRGDASGVLYADDFVVLDEAHRLPDVATDHFGDSITSFAIERQLKMLWNPRSQKGLLTSYNKAEDKQLIAEILQRSEVFFNTIHAAFLEKTPIWRQRTANWADPILHEPIARLCARLKDVAKIETKRDRQDELADVQRRLNKLNSALDDAIKLGQAPDYVYWVERSGVKGRNISVNSAPLDVAPLIREHIFERKTSVILTSATLTDSPNSMRRFQVQTGAQAIATHIEASPFDYQRNMEIFVTTDAPPPANARRRERETQDKAAWEVPVGVLELTPELEWQTAVIAHCVRAVPSGGTLVLCTSHGDVRKLHASLSAEFSGGTAGVAGADSQEKPERRVLAQLPRTSRAALVQEFRDAGDAVLIGTDSFWTGVDVPGAALSQVIILRLPFENPSNPIVEARTEWLEQQNRSPFGEMSLPAALVKFRQGIGRLIRTVTDRGRLVVLDSRVLTKTYGRHFVAALPHQRFTRFSRETMSGAIQVFR